MKKYLLLILIITLSACQAQPVPTPTAANSGPLVLTLEENPYAPKPEDASLIQTGIILTSLDLSETPQAGRTKLNILGSMPSVCSELRIKVNPPNQAYEIRIEMYSVANPGVNCDNVFQQFETNILLGEYSAGVYSIWVNSSFVGDIVSY